MTRLPYAHKEYQDQHFVWLAPSLVVNLYYRIHWCGEEEQRKGANQTDLGVGCPCSKDYFHLLHIIVTVCSKPESDTWIFDSRKSG